MTLQSVDPLTEAVTRICAQISAHSANIGDLFERMTESFYSKVVRDGDIVVDGGAHTGRHTIPLARLVGPEGAVIAFEPLTFAAEKLSRLLSATALDSRVRLRREALSRATGTSAFFVVHNMPEFSGLRSRAYVEFVPEQTEVQVDVATIDEVLNQDQRSGPLSLVKLDLEGGEFRALQGAEQTLRAWGSCCVFENGLESSADDYGPEEFFEFFKSIDYELYDILGCPVDRTRWTQSGPWQFVAMPGARTRELLPRLWASALEELLMTPWSSAGRVDPPPESFVASQSNSTGVVGHVDQVETSVRVKGWAGDLQAGRPVRSVVVTIDGVAVATAYPVKPRYDVVGATEKIEFANCGFEIVVPTTAGHRVEVFGEAADGKTIKLGG